jgi:hypothetical protein
MDVSLIMLIIVASSCYGGYIREFPASRYVMLQRS